jgi:DNA-binding XRE family transcriptional regulator
VVDLKEKREEKGYTQQSLADEVGVWRSTIAMIETGTNKPSVPLAQKIASILGFNWTEFFE